jgi:hypothetical protein
LHTHETAQVAPCSFQRKTTFDSELSDANNALWFFSMGHKLARLLMQTSEEDS